MKRLVFSAANRLSEDPACSNEAQNSADETKSTSTAAERLRSSGVQSLDSRSQEKTNTEITSKAHPRPSEIVETATAPVAPSTPISRKAPANAPTAREALRFCTRSRSG